MLASSALAGCNMPFDPAGLLCNVKIVQAAPSQPPILPIPQLLQRLRSGTASTTSIQRCSVLSSAERPAQQLCESYYKASTSAERLFAAGQWSAIHPASFMCSGIDMGCLSADMSPSVLSILQGRQASMCTTSTKKSMCGQGQWAQGTCVAGICKGELLFGSMPTCRHSYNNRTCARSSGQAKGQARQKLELVLQACCGEHMVAWALA
jgi:hypothetical protein